MISKILLATHNKGKATELKDLLKDVPIQILTLDDWPEQPVVDEKGRTFSENALQKAKAAVKFSGLISLADDSGLEVDALGGHPGVYSARFVGEFCTDLQNNLKLLQLLQEIPFAQRTARFVCAIALSTPEGQVYTAQGQCGGVILEELRGTGGFGYDPLFYLPKLGKTMAELTLEEKNMVSHRSKAWRAIVPILQGILPQGREDSR